MSEAARENARLRAAAWYTKNKERAATSCKAYREANDAKIKEQKRLAYLRNRDLPEFQAKIKANTEKAKATKPAYDREYRKRNAARLAELKAQWRADNAELLRVVKHTYKAKRRAKVKVGDSSKKVAAWLGKVPKMCLWCGVTCEDNFHIDHFYPLAKGGEHLVSNLVIACSDCNTKKNALMPEEFCARNGLNFTEIERHRCDAGMLTETA